MNFFTNSPLYYLTPYQKLLRLNVIFMVRKIEKKSIGGCLLPPPPQHSPCKNFFMDRCPKNEPTGKNLVCKKALLFPEKKWKNLLGIHCPPPLGYWRVKKFPARPCFPLAPTSDKYCLVPYTVKKTKI